MKSLILCSALCAVVLGLGGCAGSDKSIILQGDAHDRACAEVYERYKELEAELLAVEDRYANPSVANDYIQAYDEYERTIAYYNKNCATDK
ncbi:hypothetical protein [Campylobacter gracilis]|uniref:Lipoprotein n=1 Tax=Campylobacter gracilis RM3268 TaxID=553220 RepID=C8PDX8_9BACT|nr:hypothetical protein [Campylobacter gracilis]AKT92732.1 hypothetical protein CGRAC_1288 [Campylobacter gracilis]EEV18851.1 hypothetical protein CAMGR0001_2327 [Campylobacter gracilis RM3268]UEB45090.1 hypothetical protein LK410_08840 [Campylobacter gracilis]SUW82248.1 Uncharacterised protein [Campylobacter gracilis]